MSTRGAAPSLHFAASHEPMANKTTNASTLTWNDGTRATLSSNPNSRKYTASVAPTSASASLTFGDDRKNQTISAAKSDPRIRCSFTASTAATM